MVIFGIQRPWKTGSAVFSPTPPIPPYVPHGTCSTMEEMASMKSKTMDVATPGFSAPPGPAEEYCVPSSAGAGNHVLIVADSGAWCSCKGFYYRGRCRHTAEAAVNA